MGHDHFYTQKSRGVLTKASGPSPAAGPTSNVLTLLLLIILLVWGTICRPKTLTPALLLPFPQNRSIERLLLQARPCLLSLPPWSPSFGRFGRGRFCVTRFHSPPPHPPARLPARPHTLILSQQGGFFSMDRNDNETETTLLQHPLVDLLNCCSHYTAC